jgi:hypothetical protein
MATPVATGSGDWVSDSPLSRRSDLISSKQVLALATGGEKVEHMAMVASKEDLLSQLTEEHRAIKARLRQLDRHISLTSAEQVEYAQLKKMKLATKDRIRALEG